MHSHYEEDPYSKMSIFSSLLNVEGTFYPRLLVLSESKNIDITTANLQKTTPTKILLRFFYEQSS